MSSELPYCTVYAMSMAATGGRPDSSSKQTFSSLFSRQARTDSRTVQDELFCFVSSHQRPLASHQMKRVECLAPPVSYLIHIKALNQPNHSHGCCTRRLLQAHQYLISTTKVAVVCELVILKLLILSMFLPETESLACTRPKGIEPGKMKI